MIIYTYIPKWNEKVIREFTSLIQCLVEAKCKQLRRYVWGAETRVFYLSLAFTAP